MKLGIISDTHYLVTAPHGEYDLHSFTISPTSLSFSKIFHSAYATPARYVQEIFLRLCSLENVGQSTPKFIFNPLFDTGKLGLLLVLAAIKEASHFDGITIFTDKNSLPIGYLLPSCLLVKDAHFLTLLSTVDGETDSALCNLLFQIETQCLPATRLALARAQHNDFIYEENRHIYRWVAERAIAILQTNQPRDTIPFTAVMPYHAGDVLFFALAFNYVHPPIARIAVNRAYRDIIDDNAPGLAVLPIDAPIINRSDEFRQGKVTPEWVYFHSIKDALPGDSFYLYFRPSRDYNVSLFHLIDHFAFAQGRQFCTDGYLLSQHMLRPCLFQPDTTANVPVRILLHFDAGWPLKVYPQPQQEQLIDLLHAKGYAVTVLAGNRHEHTKCSVTTFKDYTTFKALLQTQHLLVGMDSFPTHYAAHVLGLPTICLFASTRPENSDARPAPNYALLEEGLLCRPCYGIARCPMYRGSSCRNFVSPETVAATVQRMLENVQKENAIRQVVPTIHYEADELCKPMPDDEPSSVKRISLKHIRLKVALAFAILLYHRYISLLYLLYREFSAAIRMEGFFLASLRTLRFLLKTFRLNTNSKNQ